MYKMKCLMKKIPMLLCLWFTAFFLLHSQDATYQIFNRPINQSTLIGIGKTYLDDSYLSPLTYDGLAISLIHDRLNGTRLFHEKLLMQNQFKIETGFTKNPSSSSSEYWGNLDYNLNGFYPLLRDKNLNLYGGAGVKANLGGIYNIRNTNNPGSLKVSTNLSLSAMTIYRLSLFTFRWQVTLPFVGMFFSPEYGHSYYEIFKLGNNQGTIHLGSFHNQPMLNSYFTIDIPISNFTIRTGYLWDYYGSDVNQLVTKIETHQFVIGLAFESFIFGGKRAMENSHFKSVYY